jgi:hypothetical protein
MSQQAAIWFFSEKIILATSAKYRHPITSFTKTECNNATHIATTHKTKRNSTQDQMQQHTPFSTMGSAFMLMRCQSFVNDFFLMMRA